MPWSLALPDPELFDKPDPNLPEKSDPEKYK